MDINRMIENKTDTSLQCRMTEKEMNLSSCSVCPAVDYHKPIPYRINEQWDCDAIYKIFSCGKISNI